MMEQLNCGMMGLENQNENKWKTPIVAFVSN